MIATSERMPRITVYLLIIATAVATVARAGIIDAPYVHGGLALNHVSPVITPVVSAPAAAAATSYSSQVRVVHNSVPVIKGHTLTPVVHVSHLDVSPELTGDGGDVVSYGYH